VESGNSEVRAQRAEKVKGAGNHPKERRGLPLLSISFECGLSSGDISRTYTEN
jgi:hypothetical protein